MLTQIDFPYQNSPRQEGTFQRMVQIQAYLNDLLYFTMSRY